LPAPPSLYTLSLHDALPIFGGKQLGRFFIEYDALAGTVIDAAWAEDLTGSLPSVMKRPGLYTGTRHVSAGGFSRFETIKPYGSRDRKSTRLNSSHVEISYAV